jgi:signal transduction histidine kinase
LDTLSTLNVGLAGFFAWGAIHYATHWWFSRRERIFLAFAIQCALYTAFCLGMASFLRAKTIPDSQTALDRFVTIGVLTHAGFLNIYSLINGRRDRVFRALVTAAIVFLAVLNQFAPLRGTIVELRTMHLPGGATALLPIRTLPGASLILLYVLVLVIYGYGLVAARTIWKRDRIGSVLIGVAAAAILAGAALGFLVDFAHLRAPYAGAWPHVIFVLSVSLFLSREYAARGARVVASEGRAEQALQEAQHALANLQAEQRRREELELERQKTTAGLVQAQRMELASELAAGVAHDFNNVLGVIALWLSVLKSSSRSFAEEDRAWQALANAQQQGQALSRQLMAVTRRDTRAVTRLPLDRPIRSTLMTLTSALPRNIHLQFEATAASEVEANETEIQQVVYNLVLNARDAMPDGGTIRVSAGLVTSPLPIAIEGGSLAAGTWALLIFN